MKSWDSCVGVFLYISNLDRERKCHPTPLNNDFLLGAWEGKEKNRQFFRTLGTPMLAGSILVDNI